MIDTPPHTSLADQALSRLRKLADGNGLAADAIQILGTEEQVYTLNGLLLLMPLFETVATHYAGPPQGRDRKILSDAATLRAEVEQRKQAFEKRPDWIKAATSELKQQPAEGWGLDDVRIPLPTLSAILAASTPCPTCGGRKMTMCAQCRGQGTIVCTRCRGQRQEICYNCMGRGVNPAAPDQRCPICNGMRYIPCRICRASGQIVCPLCQGRRGITCTTCQGAGQMTEEIAISCGARTHFTIKGEGMPSGFRRGLDRIGIVNLTKGFADIETIVPKDEQDDLRDGFASPPGMMPPSDDPQEKPLKPEIHYIAHVPYADLRMSFNGKKAFVSAFGKRCALMGVPNFLDDAIAPAREKLKQAVVGQTSLDEAAMAVRVIRDALTLELAGNGEVKELRRIYSLGLSSDIAKEVLGNMRLALARCTRRARSVVASLAALLSAGLFTGLFFTPLHTRMTEHLPWTTGLAADAVLLLLIMGLSWFTLGLATRLILSRHFPGALISMRQKAGNIGYIMLGAIVVFYLAALFLTPLKPLWLLRLMHG